MLSGTLELSAAEAASRLGVSHGHVAQLMRDGVLAARQLPSGVWLTSATALETCAATMRRGSGRGLNAESAWGLLWELSGQQARWLSRSTLSRLRALIVDSTPEDIVRAVSGRSRQTRYEVANDGASDALALTGSAVAGTLKAGLKNWTDIVSGYVRVGTVAAHAQRYEMLPNYEGRHTLFEWTLPVAYDERRMPSAVIAADLATSHRPTERVHGLRALNRLKSEWIQAL